MSSTEPATEPAQPAVKAPSQNVRSTKGQSRKKRVVRRRGRARGGMESDEEIEREVATSESEDDEEDDRSSSSDSATDDSDTEPGSEDVPSNIQSPSTSKDVGVEGVTHINGAAAPFFTSSLAWSEMVTDENENGAAGLPVIEFAEFSEASKIPARPSKKSKQKQKKAAAAASGPAAPPAQEHESVEEEEPATELPKSPASPLLPRKLGQTARQAYQERLEKDPSYVPKVGGFWGHDDRLMDKDLRSLSGWWRGQWQGRGRGRGFGGRGGGRGGHAPFSPSLEVAPEDLPPVERTWGHDGFEEMKRKEEERQAHQEGPAGRGRGGFRGGRGGFAGRGRGTFKQHPAPPPHGAVLSPTSRRLRPPFAKKPERPFSQESAASLEAAATQAPARELQYVVRLPARSVEQPKVSVPQAPAAAPAKAPAPELASISEVAQTPTPAPAPVPVPAPISTTASDDTCSSQPSPAVISQLEQLSLEPAFSDPNRQAKTAEAVLRNPGQDGNSEGLEGVANDPRSSLPPLQTVFTPPPPPISQPSPVYGSPYSFPPSLPPGIALNHHGMPYEMATGRPVYLQAPPPPPPMYNPRPIMHSHHPSLSYGHVPHPTVTSPDFLAQPPSHTPPMNGFIDPSTGAPIFSFPRASARLEIRAPDDPHRSPPSNGKAAANRGPSKLRTTAMAFEPSRSSQGDGERYYPSISTTPSDGSGLPPSYETVNGSLPEEPAEQQQQQQQQPAMGPMMPYNPYQQQYYYPDAYGYNPYMDMPPQHAGQYDGYNVDQSQQQTVYY
ncbi:hypothetical protein DFP72DRAFT_1147992 [Ephemerocybe angulata]|uniref:Btz domain-containing protein n=1 Tax=Ephemerocybe angulata TaxID=980116 RepID=A0A8H6MED4_9AGAR|nr:hypothetical protein DFP72DRAFT_1147992 [Tulosesus angulatus]